MIPTPGYVYFISDEFFELFGSPQFSKLCYNKGSGHARPYYCCKKDHDSDLFWMIPMTAKYDKYCTRYLNQKANYGKCITITLAKYAGKPAAILIQNSVPVHPKFITEPFLKNGNPVPMHTTIQRIVYGNLQQSLAIHRRGKQIFFPDVDYIKEIQQTLQERGFQLPLVQRITAAMERAAAPHRSYHEEKDRPTPMQR